jgi:hypothetical protein
MSRNANKRQVTEAQPAEEIVTETSTAEVVQSVPVADEQQIVEQAAPTITKMEDVDLTKCTTESARIRALGAAGFKNGPIAKYLSELRGRKMLYQHVRNVLNTPVKSQAQPT